MSLPKTWHFSENLDAPFHATPYCPAIRPRDRPQLEMTRGAPDYRYSCYECCPVDLFILKREVSRTPMTFHADESCHALREEHGADPRFFETEWYGWPSRTHQ